MGATKLVVRDAPSWWLHPMRCVRLRALLWYAIRRRRGSQRAFAPRLGQAAPAEGVLAGCCPHAVLGHMLVVTPKKLWRDRKLRHEWQAQGAQVKT